MELEGIHHVTAITADAQRNVDFYAGVLGLRLVKKTVNQDNPSVYHLFYADEKGEPGSDITFFEYPGAAPGRAGDGMIHRIVWRVGSESALDFWTERLGERDVAVGGVEGRHALRFRDHEGLEHELTVSDAADEPMVANHPEIPAELALQGFDGVCAYASEPDRSRELLAGALGFNLREESEGAVLWERRGRSRGSLYVYHDAPDEPGVEGAGTVHHVAWASPAEEQKEWRDRVIAAGMRPTPVIDRFYFQSVYFREPSGVLFEIATLGGAGFAIDEPIESLGEKLSLPPFIEHLRAEIEPNLRPIVNPRQITGAASSAPRPGAAG